jgi:membrane protease YdiL (CAAX protease family)
VGGTGSYAETIGSLVGLWAGLIPGTLLVCRVRATGNVVKDLGLRFSFPGDLIGIVVGLGSQFLLLPIVYAVIQIFSGDLTKRLEEPAKDLTDNAHGGGFMLLAVLLVVGAPLVEEIFYRGLLLRSLKRYVPAWPAIILCGAIFGAAHFDLVTLPGLALFGVLLAWLAHRSGRLGPNIVAHAAFNAATVAILWHG